MIVNKRTNKNILFLLILFSIILISKLSMAQSPEYVWAVDGSGSGFNGSTNLVVDNSGNTIITGYFDSTITFGSNILASAGSSDIFIVKYDPNGKVIWATRAGGTDYDQAYSVALDNSGNIIITGLFSLSITFGSTTLRSSGANDIFIAKYSSAGVPDWAVRAGGKSYDVSYDITTDNLDNIIITGTFQNAADFGSINIIGNSYSDFFIAKYDSRGIIQWVQAGGGLSTSFNYYQGNGLTSDADNNVFVTGTFSDTMSFVAGNFADDLISNGSNDIFVAKYSSNGNFIWSRRAGGSAYDAGDDIIINKDNIILVTGTFSGLSDFGKINLQSYGYSDFFISAYDQLGNAIWVTHGGNVDSVDNYEGTKISLDSLDDISMIARISTSQETSNLYLGRFDKEGNEIWNTIITGNIFTYDGGVANFTNNDIIFSGIFIGSIKLGQFGLAGVENPDIFLAKLEFPKLIYDENPLDFGVVPIGNTLNRSAVFSNTSDVDITTISIRLAGPDIDNFSMPIVIQESIIPAHESRSINISFTPTRSGEQNVYLIIGSNSISTPDTLVITGIGGIPPLLFTPDTLKFGGVRIGENLTQNLRLLNNSSVTVNISKISLQGPDANNFSIVQGIPIDSLEPDMTADISINFSPQDPNPKSAYLVLESNSFTSPDTAFITGDGIVGMPDFTFSADTLNFGSVDVGNYSELNLTITRTRPADLIINNFIFTGIDNNEFTLVNTILPDTIPALGFKNYLIRFTPENSGEKSIVLNLSSNALSNPDSVILIGTAISSIKVNSPNSTGIGQNTNLNVIPPSGFSFTITDFFYRMSGESNYQQANLAFLDSFYVANIPASFSTIRGIQYYIIFSDGENTITYPTDDPINNPAEIQVKVSQFVYPIAIKKSVYQMISIPLSTPLPSIDSILVDDYGSYDSTVWRLFNWNNPRNNYLEYTNISSGIIPGKAYWLINKDGRSFDINNASSISTSSPYLIQLESGWNQIGDPYSFPVEWDSIGNSQLISSRPQRWNSDIENYEIDQQILNPWEGYWVYNDNEPTNLSVRPIAAQIPITKKLIQEGLSNNEFLIQIKAYSTSKVQDPSNFIGMINEDKYELKTHDILEPPPISDKLRLSFISNDKEFAQKIVSPSNEGAFWDIKIISSLQNKKVQLELLKKSNLPDGFEIWFLDLDKMVTSPIVDDKINLLLPENGTGRYRIIIGNENFAKQNSMNVSLLPLEYSLLQNYPNPFNPNTNIVYQLKERSNVSLEIFNAIGEKIMTLVNNEIQNPGIHNVTWNGLNSSGNKIASGVYIYRITANNFTQSKKMVLLQ